MGRETQSAMLFTNNTTRTASVSARERDTHKQTHAQRSTERERRERGEVVEDFLLLQTTRRAMMTSSLTGMGAFGDRR